MLTFNDASFTFTLLDFRLHQVHIIPVNFARHHDFHGPFGLPISKEELFHRIKIALIVQNHGDGEMPRGKLFFSVCVCFEVNQARGQKCCLFVLIPDEEKKNYRKSRVKIYITGYLGEFLVLVILLPCTVEYSPR